MVGLLAGTPREHLPTRTLAGQNDSMHGVLCVLRHLAHMP
jgi:hypothetical protein